jgi:16S rRNA G527 N7-methylase RsmG
MATIHSYQDIHFDVDLIDAARKQVEFLHLVDKQGNLYEGPLVKHAIFRY